MDDSARAKNIREWLRRHLAVIVALIIGLLAGFAAGAVVTGSGITAVAAIALGVLTAGAAGIFQEAVTKASKTSVAIVAGKRPGHRRLDPSLFERTRVMGHRGGDSFEPERWVDLKELDHRGFFYGVAQSPTYIPLYGTGLVEIREIQLICPESSHEVAEGPAEDLLSSQIQELEKEHAAAGRPFYDEPLVRLLSWQPPVNAATPLVIRAEQVGHKRYAAATTLLRTDDGSLRERFRVESREFANPVVQGAIGVEVAVVTSDNKLLLGHRGGTTTDYRDQIVVSFGEGIDPTRDRSSSHPKRLDPWATVTRGLLEELGLEVDGHAATFLALGAELSRMDPDLLGYIRIPHSSRDVQNAMLAGQARDRWETNTVTFIEFTPDAVADLLGGALRKGLTPATPMNLVFSMSHAFGEAETQRALAR
jgi:hypothetical protein